MHEVIEKYRIDGVWHFTDEENLPSIMKMGGLLSYANLNKHGVAITAPGGNDWSHEADVRAGVDKYVHLALIPNHPMLFLAKNDGRIKKPIWLKIDPSILTIDGVRFTRQVANKTGEKLLTPNEAKDQIDWEVLFTRTDWNDPTIKARRQAAEKSQILVPNSIPLGKILGKMNG